MSKQLQLNLVLQKHKSELFDERREHDRQCYAQSRAHPTAAQEGPSDSAPAKSKTSAPKLSLIIKSFLDGYQKNKHPAMFKKHQSALPMFLNFIGDKPINEIKQIDIKKFFELIESLPPRWSDECRKRAISIQVLAKLTHPITIAPKTFKCTYIASNKAFLISAKSDCQDQGFPVTLTTNGIDYHGTRVEGENAQRPFKPSELTRLFGGSEMRGFASDKLKAHYWLPLIGLTQVPALMKFAKSIHSQTF